MIRAGDPEWEALLRAVCESPDDDLPRLVAADWLDDRGEADRAELIRVQCALAAGGGDAAGLARRERALLGPTAVNRTLWALEACPQLVRVGFRAGGAALAAAEVSGAERLTFRRGFVEAVTCPAADWLRHGAAVRARQPVRAVALTACNRVEAGDWWAGLPALERLSAVAVAEAPGWLPAWLRERLPGAAVREAG